jgi:hypothetical protein
MALAIVSNDSEGLPEYPISSVERLDSHFFVAWNLKRWEASDFRRQAYSDPEVGFFGRELFDLSHGQSPVGTLPMDTAAQAFLLRMTRDRWEGLCARSFSPLSGWYPVQCDNGEIRLAHDVVTEVAIAALESSRRNRANAEARKRAKRLADLREKIEQIGSANLLKQPNFLDRFNDWLEDHHPDEQRREPLIRSALDAFSVHQEVRK